jgi:hypothetical protein
MTTTIPFALFRTHDGRTVAMSKEQYEQARAVARICRCGTCDCCRAVEYVTETEAAQRGEYLPPRA